MKSPCRNCDKKTLLPQCSNQCKEIDEFQDALLNYNNMFLTNNDYCPTEPFSIVNSEIMVSHF